MKIFIPILLVFTFFSACMAQTTNRDFVCKKEIKELWRELADSGRYHEAINILMDSIQKGKQKNKKSSYWHVGQLYACNNEYELAIEYLKKSTSFIDQIFDREWRLYYKGTIAFLKRDKKKLKVYNDRLWKKHSDYYYFNACKLKAFYENFGMPYSRVYDMPCE